jgi:hypothetical protein
MAWNKVKEVPELRKVKEGGGMKETYTVTCSFEIELDLLDNSSYENSHHNKELIRQEVIKAVNGFNVKDVKVSSVVLGSPFSGDWEPKQEPSKEKTMEYFREV